MSSKNDLIRVLSISLLSFTLSACQHITESFTTSLVVLEQKEIEQSKQLKDLIIKKAAHLVDSQDIFYLVTQRVMPLCGNDARYDNMTKPEDAEEEQNYIKENPFYVNLHEHFDSIYIIQDKVVVPGMSFEEDFVSDIFEFTYDPENHKHMYVISVSHVQPDTVYATVYDYYQRNEFSTDMVFIRQNNI